MRLMDSSSLQLLLVEILTLDSQNRCLKEINITKTPQFYELGQIICVKNNLSIKNVIKY